MQVFWLRGENLLLRFLQLQLRHQSLVKGIVCFTFPQMGNLFDSFLHLRSIVQPTAFRKSENYVIYYHSWTWTIVTGNYLETFIWLIFLYHRYLKTFTLTLIFCGQPHKPDKLIPTNVSKVQALYLSISTISKIFENPL